MNLDDLRTQLEMYHNALSNVELYRKEWSSVKELVHRTFSEIVKESELNAEVGTEKKLEGMENVYLGFGKRESGVFELKEGVRKPLFKEGGYLFYTQLFNGRVSVWIALPTIENLVMIQPPKLIKIYIPAEITETLIIRHVSAFLIQMTAWEDKDSGPHELGFKIKPQ